MDVGSILEFMKICNFSLLNQEEGGCWMIRNLCAMIVLGMLAASGRADARDMNIRVFEINDYLTAFYDGRPAQAPRPASVQNWADYGAIDVGVATYVIHRGAQALIYDSFPYAEEAKWVRDYLTKRGIKHVTLVNSHWHLDHVGGNAVYSGADRIATNRAIEMLTVA